MLTAQGIYKSYGSLQVLKGIDVHINKGEVVSIVGASGAGKSTLLHIIGTLDSADKGSLQIANTEVNKLNQQKLSEFRNREIGFIFQFHNLLPEFTALENIMIPGLIGQRNPAEVKQKAMELLELLKIAGRHDHKPSQLSGGEQQRVSVARALINSPAIIFADEPSGNLDSHNADELHKLFFDLRDRLGQTFVIVTHNESLAASADRTIEIKDGIIYTPA